MGAATEQAHTSELHDERQPWSPEHGLVVELLDDTGAWAGFLSVDRPSTGRLPDDETLELLELLACTATDDGNEAGRTFVGPTRRWRRWPRGKGHGVVVQKAVSTPSVMSVAPVSAADATSAVASARALGRVAVDLADQVDVDLDRPGRSRSTRPHVVSGMVVEITVDQG